MLRRCRILRLSIPELWTQRLTSEEVKSTADGDNGFQKRYGDWDASHSAMVTFKPALTEDVIIKENKAVSQVRRVALRGLIPLLAPIVLFPSGIISVVDMMTICALTSIGTGWFFTYNAVFIRLVRDMRIIPEFEDSPVGTVVEITTQQHCWSVSTKTTLVKLQNILNVTCSKDGQWLALVVRHDNTNKNDTYYLHTFDGAVHIIPYILTMKKHLVEEAPEFYTPTYVTLGSLYFSYLVSVEKIELPEVSVLHPYPDFSKAKPLKLRPGSLGYKETDSDEKDDTEPQK